jgi:hypothetical protein
MKECKGQGSIYIRTDNRTCRIVLLPVQTVGKGAHVPTVDRPDTT